MGKTYRPWNPNQQYLLPPSVQDWLPENDLVYFILDTVNELDISAILQKYEQEKRGFPPYHPRMMAALLLYSYCRGIFSSRKIMQACQERISFKVIVGDDIPDFRTISDFRKLHLKELQLLFVQVLQLCQEAGLVKLGHVALDGTKIKANASRHKAMSYGRMLKEEKRLKEEIRELLEKAKAIDEQEDNKYGVDRRGDELPEELARRESRIKRIQEAKKALEAKAKAVAEQTRKQREQEDSKNDDKQQFEPMLEKTQDNVGKDKDIKAASADSGYYSESNVEYGQDKKIDVYIATGKIKHNAPVVKAPRGRIPKNLTVKEKMARRLRTKKGRETYSKRKVIVEPVFGQIKRARGFVQFSLRGLEKMRGEWAIVCLTHNLLKLFRAEYAIVA